MAENPYDFGDDVDDDLWNKQAGTRGEGHANFSDHADSAEFHVAANGGEECPGCGKIHTIPKALSSLPRQLHGMTAKLLDGFEHGTIATVDAQRVPNSLRIMASMVSFTRDVQTSNIDMPTVRAVAEILDEMTDGKVRGKINLYAAERDLRAAHFTCKTVNSFAEFVRADTFGVFARADDNFDEVVGHILNYQTALRDAAIIVYKEQCEFAGVEIDERLVDTGQHTKGSPAEESRTTYFKTFFAEHE